MDTEALNLLRAPGSPLGEGDGNGGSCAPLFVFRRLHGTAPFKFDFCCSLVQGVLFTFFKVTPRVSLFQLPLQQASGGTPGGRQLRLMHQGHGRTSAEHRYPSRSSCHSSRVSEQSGWVEIGPQKISLEHPTRCNGTPRKGDQPNNWRAASQRPAGPVRFNLNFDEDVSEIGSHVACLLRAGVRGFRGDLRCLCLDVCRCVRDVCFPRFLVLFGLPVVVWDCLLRWASSFSTSVRVIRSS